MTAGPVLVAGRTVTLPVVVRAADAWAAHFAVPAGPAQEIAGRAGLQVAQPIPGRALLTIAFVRYAGSDLGAYREVAFSLLVRPHDAPPGRRLAAPVREALRRDVRPYIFRMPVDQAFTLEAGRTIWGYPKTAAEIAIEATPETAECVLADERGPVLALTVREGPVPVPAISPPTYTFLDGVLRLVRWEVRVRRARARPDGASLVLADHPVADELRALGMPRGTLLSTSLRGLRARFHAARVVG